MSVTVTPPLLGVILFVLVFGMILSVRIGEIYGYPYITFMFPGLMMMMTTMNAYTHSSWSLFQARMEGWIKPVLSAPLSYPQIVLAYILAGIFRGMLVGSIALIAVLILPVNIPLASPLILLAYMLLASFVAASLGLIVGLWATRWDHIAVVSWCALEPLIFLGCVFYSFEMIKDIPILALFTKFNPATYMADGFRRGIIGMSELDTATGLIAITILSVALFAMGVILFKRGYHLRV